MLDFGVLLNLNIEQKQAAAAYTLLKKISVELEKLKKTAASGVEIDVKTKELKAVLEAYTQIKNEKVKGAKADKEAYPFGIKTLELSKLQLQKAQELAKAQAEREKAEAKAAALSEKAAAKAQADADKKAAAEQKIIDALLEENRILSKQADTLGEVEKQNALLVKQRKKLSLTNKDDIETFNQLTAQIKQNQDILNENNSAIGRHQGSVGDYLKVWEGLPGPISNAAGAVGGFGEQLKALASNPYAAIIALIAAAVATLGKAFMETAGGAKIMDNVLAYSRGTWDLVRMKAKEVGDSLSNITWEKTANGAKNLATSLIGGFINRITDPFKNMISIFKSLFTWDFENIGGKFKKLGASIADFFTQGGYSGAKNMVKGLVSVGNEIDTLAKKQMNLIITQRNLEFATMGYNEAIAKQAAAVELLSSKVDADSLSQKENEKAAIDLVAATEKLAAMKRALAAANVAAAQAEVDNGVATGKSIDSMGESYKKLSDAKVAAIDADSEYAQTVFDNREKITKRAMDWADLDLDILIDGYDNRKTIMERTAAMETTTAAQRAKLLTDFKAQEDKNRNEALVTLQQFSKNKIDLAALESETDERALQNRIKDLGMTERMGIRLFELIRERRTWSQDLTELEINNAKLNADAQKQAFDKKIENFEKEQELEKLKFENKKTTDQEKAIFEAEQKLAADQMKLLAAQEFGLKMSEIETANLNQQILNDQTALASAKDTTKGKIELKQLEQQAVQNGLDMAIRAFGEESKIGKRLGQIKQVLALKDAFLQAKGALLKAWNSAPFPANLGAIATTALTTAPLVSAIAAIKFERGGMLKGRSHAQGGIPAMGGRVELEGNEAVINKKSTEAFYPILSAINSFQGWGNSFGGEKTKFATGGVLPSEDRLAGTQDVQIKYQPVLLVQDVTDLQNSDSRVEAILRG